MICTNLDGKCLSGSREQTSILFIYYFALSLHSNKIFSTEGCFLPSLNLSRFPHTLARRDGAREGVWFSCYLSFVFSSWGLPKIQHRFSLTDRKTIKEAVIEVVVKRRWLNLKKNWLNYLQITWLYKVSRTRVWRKRDYNGVAMFVSALFKLQKWKRNWTWLSHVLSWERESGRKQD